MNLSISARPFLTWLDVERAFKRATSNFSSFEAGVVSVQCFYDGAEIEYAGDSQQVEDWLRSVFGRSLSEDGVRLTLQIGGAQYPLELVPVPDRSQKVPSQYPLWRDQAYLDPEVVQLPTPWEGGPHVCAFHSFKGGVGRTTTLMTYVAATVGKKKNGTTRLLLIDADLEAPGISFWLEPTNRPTVSFVHLLEAVHYPPKDVDCSLEYFASELRKTSLNVSGVSREVFILPAALELSEIMDMPVHPEHIASNPENPWLLSDHIRALGQKLRADIIFIDLRAGLSELASPLLFDPRIEHFFVTTVAPQSVTGMGEVLRRVHKFQHTLRGEQRSCAKPTLVLNMLTPQLRQLPDYAKALQEINLAFPSDDDDLVSLGLELVEADFEPSLMSIGSVRHAIECLSKSSLYDRAFEWATERSEAPVAIADGALSGDEQARQFHALYTVCERFQFAERTAADDMLVTEPLRNLAKHYFDELPNAVSIGAKGAGKTFTFLQICRRQTWEGFLSALGYDGAGVEGGEIYPALASSNIDGDSLKVVNGALENALLALHGTENRARASCALRSMVSSALKDDSTDWEQFWGASLAKCVLPEVDSLQALNDWLGTNRKSVVFAIDGIEDIIEAPSEENQRSALKALLELPNQLNNLRHRRVGLVCFIRADYVQSAIRQNVSQYVARFQPFRLEWTAETFLRLAYWICGKASAIDADPGVADQLTVNELLSRLEKLWGKKMGRDDSKEAVTARWVFAALCDLNGRLQARDLVRFLKFAAKRMKGVTSGAWRDRVLYPEMIRKSVADCSDEKVNEAISEVAALRRWKESLDKLDPDVKKTPFSAEALGLSTELLTSLRELGVVYEDIDQKEEPERFYLPEIYRTGLGFRSAVGGRPRVQALLKRNLGGMPF